MWLSLSYYHKTSENCIPIGTWNLIYPRSVVWTTVLHVWLQNELSVILFEMIVVFRCHQPLVQSWWFQVLSAAIIVFSSQALPDPPCDLTYQNRRKKKRGENFLAALRDSNLRAIEMEHMVNAKQESPFFEKPTAMLSGKSPINANSASCWLLLKWFVPKSRIWFDLSPSPQRRLWAQLGVVSLLGHNWQWCQNRIHQVAKFLKKKSHAEVIKY